MGNSTQELHSKCSLLSWPLMILSDFLLCPWIEIYLFDDHMSYIVRVIIKNVFFFLFPDLYPDFELNFNHKLIYKNKNEGSLIEIRIMVTEIDTIEKKIDKGKGGKKRV